MTKGKKKLPCPTKEEIEKLAHNNIILHAALNAREVGRLTWTEALQLAIKLLIEESERQKDQLFKMAQIKTDTILVVEGQIKDF